jgi:hypothetical protein
MGLPIGLPTAPFVSLQDAWKRGLKIVHGGLFSGFKELEFTFGVAKNDGPSGTVGEYRWNRHEISDQAEIVSYKSDREDRLIS